MALTGADSGVVQGIPTSSLPIGANPNLNMDRLMALSVNELCGKYYNLAYNGLVYIGMSAITGIVTPVAGTSSPTFGLWNPANSGKNAMIISLTLTYLSTTAAAGGWTWSTTAGAGTGLATAAPISAFNAGTPTNALFGAGGTSAMKFSPAGTNTLTAAAVIYRGTGIGTNAMVATTATNPWTMREDYDGTFILPPNNAIWLTASAAVLIVTIPTLIWAELPV